MPVDHGRTLAAAVLLFLLPLLAHSQGFNFFEASPGTTTESLAAKASSYTQLAATTDSDTAPFSIARNTYYRGSVVLNIMNNVDTPEDCLSLCLDESRCELWSHCPSNATIGCEVAEFCTADDDATANVMEAGTCIMSRNEELEKAILSVEGDGVAWTAGMYAEKDDKRSPAPDGGPPLIAPSKSPSPPGTSTEACFTHEVPTDWAITALQNTMDYVPALGFGGQAPPCYDPQSMNYTDPHASYAACRPQSIVNQNVQTLAQKLCDSTTGSGKDADVGGAQALFFSAIKAGGQEAIEAVAAVIYAHSGLRCWPGTTVVDVVSPPYNEVMKTDTLYGAITNLLQFFTNVANAAEYAGLGLCTTVIIREDNDYSTSRVLTTVHTGTDT